MFQLRVAAAALVVSGALAASLPSGDARRGEQLFGSERCVQCHGVNGRGGTAAPDLAKSLDRDFTPTGMASLMWNHAPAMWSAMKKQGVNRPTLTPEQSADLFAYFVSARYFEKPGDAGRGKQAFAAKHCAECHGIASSSYAGAPPVVKWESLSDPVVLAQQMWNHGPKMRQAYAGKKLSWSELTAQELTDILVYLRNLPETKPLARGFQFTPSGAGEQLFAAKGCAGCHTGRNALESKLHNQTLTEIAVDMWNHQPSMKNPPPTLTADEMRQVLSYVWARQYFLGGGDAARGKTVFAEKKCGACHGQPASGATALAKGKDAYSAVTMVSALWEHGPRMLDTMQQKKQAWPQFAGGQMADLIAYLNTL
ncbi:MAG: c-type cytochrome [Bryobacteraceae bacterium]|jgi:mono/diheme cytochrome c family protein